MTVLDARFARRLSPIALIAAIMLGGFVAGVSRGEALAHADHGMPARLQLGTCDVVGPVAFELTGIGATEDVDGNEIPAPEIVGAASAGAVQAGVTTVPAALDAIVSGGHALVVYQSDEAMDVAVACGDVGGIVVGEDLVVGLSAEGEAGMSGIALFRVEGEQTVVSVFLTPAEHEHDEVHEHEHGEDSGATPEA